ncbi:hypothetical protein JXB12_09805 [candidate division KSB1 bacterium]|nr:hypothetical protein [candidate division KSB1 bacterium]
MRHHTHGVSVLLFVLGIALITQCARQKKEAIKEGDILVKIDDKVITVDEFIRRAEYTIRPPYCQRDNYIHKKIVLNSLIAEKLLALEAGNPPDLLQNEQYSNYIRGRKEQVMLQMYYHRNAYERVELDSSEIKTAFKLAGRTYDVSFFSVDEADKATLFIDRLNQTDARFEDLYEFYFGDRDIPEKEVPWSKDINDPLQQAMFSDPLLKGQIVGPVNIEDGDYFLVIRVNGWVDRPAITDTQISERLRDVTESLTKQQAMAIYKERVAEIMRGKRLEFSNETFNRLSEYLAPFYMKTEEDKKEAFNKRFWENELVSDSVITSLKQIIDDPLLRIDGETWDLKRFFREISIHPLVFRQRNISNRDFPAQLRLAIVDMVQDKYVVSEAYKQGLDQLPTVQQYTAMWEDNLLSLYQKNHYLRTKDTQGMDYLATIEHYLNPYVDSLQIKYHDVIGINTDLFENINLTNIDMFVVQRNVPFPVIVPGFPLLTTDNTLDYGRKISNEK